MDAKTKILVFAELFDDLERFAADILDESEVAVSKLCELEVPDEGGLVTEYAQQKVEYNNRRAEYLHNITSLDMKLTLIRNFREEYIECLPTEMTEDLKEDLETIDTQLDAAYKCLKSAEIPREM